jgi:hypothetical protein
MTDQWKRVVEVFDSAIDREPTDRSLFVHQACTGDEDLRGARLKRCLPKPTAQSGRW